MKLSKQEEKVFLEATVCSICDKPLCQKRCRDHNHGAGEYRGAAHMDFNINYKLPKTIPIIFHKLKHYDDNHLMTTLGKFKISPSKS